MYLSKSQVDDYERDGAIVIKGVFKDWIDCLRTGFDKVLSSPSEHGRENVAKGDAGRFFEDYCNWQRIDEFNNGLITHLQLKSPHKRPLQNAFKCFMIIF